MFPDTDLVRSPVPGTPPLWQELFSTQREIGLAHLADAMSLPSQSTFRQTIMCAQDFAMVLPRRKRQKKQIRMWYLAVQYSPSQALFFHPPTPQLLACRDEFSEEYQRIISSLGSLRFSESSGHLMCPSFIAEDSANLQQRYGRAWPEPVHAFFDHHTGDYDCWKGRDFGKVWYLDHETGEMTLYSTGGFPVWLEKMFEDTQAGRR
jgi:hypothetical protein